VSSIRLVCGFALVTAKRAAAIRQHALSPPEDAQSFISRQEALMQFGRFIRPIAHSLAAALMVSAPAGTALAQGHDHGGDVVSQSHKSTAQENELVQAVRDATERFKNVTSVAGPGEGYGLGFGCVSGGDFGAMGMHYINMRLVGDNEIKAEEPEIILFEPTRDGGIRITGVDYLVDKAGWESNPDHKGPPELKGQLFHLFDSPNRFGLDPFYTLHVWAWKDNPNGTFANWNPNVSCDAFNPPKDQ